MATDLTDWGPEINFHIAGVPEPALQIAVRNAAIKFCEKTHLWTQDLTEIGVEADTQAYALSDPDDAKIIGIQSAKYKPDAADDDQYVTLDPASEHQQDYFGHGNWKYTEATAPSQYWVDNVDKQIHLVPIPDTDSAEGLLVKVILKPDATCTELPDFIYEDWKDAITLGALSDLYARKRTPWYDPNEALLKLKLFIAACNNAKTNKITGATNRPMRVRMVRFA